MRNSNLRLFRKNPEEFLARIEAKASKEAALKAAAKPKEFSLPGQAKEKLEAASGGQKLPGQGGQKSLDSVLKLDLLADKSAGEIEQIWCKHFSSKVSC